MLLLICKEQITIPAAFLSYAPCIFMHISQFAPFVQDPEALKCNKMCISGNSVLRFIYFYSSAHLETIGLHSFSDQRPRESKQHAILQLCITTDLHITGIN